MHRLIGGIGAILLLLSGWLLARTLFFQPLLAASGGSVTGKVVLVGEASKPKKINVTKDKEKCGADKIAEELVVGPDKGIKYAVVSLPGIKGKPAKAAEPTIDQKGCAFNPHVVVVPAGTPLNILNSDGILHNIHTYSSKNPPINKAQPGFRKKIAETFAQPEIFRLTCDAHAWMTGWIVVADSAFTQTTDASGGFKLVNVPAGTHKIEVWHETLGKVTKEITVKAGEDTKVTIELSNK